MGFKLTLNAALCKHDNRMLSKAFTATKLVKFRVIAAVSGGWKRVYRRFENYLCSRRQGNWWQSSLSIRWFTCPSNQLKRLLTWESLTAW